MMEKIRKKIIPVLFLLGILFSVSISEGNNLTEDFIEQNSISDLNSIPQSAFYYEDLAEEYTDSSGFVKMKELILTESAEIIEFSFESHSIPPSGHTCYITIDDGASMASISGAIADYTTRDGTLSGNFPVGTKVQLWMRTWTPGMPAYCRNFFIYTRNVFSDVAEESTNSDSFVKMKELILPESANDIQYSFESHSTLTSGHTCYITIDDGASMASIGGAIADYTTRNGTLSGSFPAGTKVQLWMRTWTGGGSYPAYCRNFFINSGYLYSDNAEESTSFTIYTKMKELILAEGANDIHYSFESHSTPTSGHTCYITINDGDSMASIGGVSADYTTRNGTLSGNFPVGTKVQLWMRSWTPGYLAYCRNFNINTHILPVAPILIAPSDGSSTINIAPEFSWGTVSYASQFQIQIDNNIDFLSTFADFTSGSLTYIPSDLDDDVYYWRVRCQDVFGNWGSWSAVWNVEIDTTGPVAPALIAPSDGSSTINIAPEFSWSVVGDADQYQIQIDNNVDFLSTFADFTSGSLTYIPSDLDDDVYYWRVRCQDVLGNWGLWSAVWNVEIDTTAPVAPALSTPLNESIISNPTPTFTWSSVGDATQYQIQIDNNSDFLSTFADFTSDSLTYIPSDLDDDVYYWRVRCQDVLENWGSWSAVWNVEIDTTVPELNDFSDISYTEGDAGNEIIWTVFDEHPSTYSITLDGSEIESGAWIDGQTFTIDVDGLAIGEHTYEITVVDSANNEASDTVVVTINEIIDDENPIVSEPEDISYEVGETGNIITWVATDANPDYYELNINGVLIATIDWVSGVDIVIDVDGLDKGTYNYTIVVFDAYGNSVSDTVEVEVTGASIPGYELEVMSLVSLFAIIFLIKNKKK